MSAKKTLKIYRSRNEYNSFAEAKAAMSATTVAEGEPVLAYYQDELGVTRAILGFGGKNGDGKIYYSDESYTSYGTYDNRPSTPKVGQMYYCTDKKSSINLGSDNGVTMWYRGNNVWTDALGTVIS